ncbi:FUSC family protein [Aureimonas sp. OT7]|uniref:FUSC family protein n=1 Tax=Aureimonas TaxID=414371 RepID=UPI00177EFB8C|nr:MULTISPECIES: FUSC family protein [Aureimonas]QOG07996.1 FUSC family protein [Aureimonas sp. OT7]
MSIKSTLSSERDTAGLRQRFLASDPGLVRLRLGSRVLLTVALVAGILALAHPWIAFPPSAYGMAMVTAIQGAVAIKDATPSARAVTRAYAVAAAYATVVAITLLNGRTIAVSALFLAVIFVSVYARRFGLRWQAVGMFTFMCFVIAAYLHPQPTDLPGIAVSLVLSSVIAHLIRNFLLPDRPAEDFQRGLEAVDEIVGRLAGRIRRAARNGWSPASRREALDMERRAKDAILICEGYLPVQAEADDPSSRRAATLANDLFDLHLALESALGSALAMPAPGSGKLPEGVAGRLDILAKARREVRRSAAATPAAAFAAGGGTAAQGRVAKGGAGRKRPLDDPFLRQALQVTLASAIAMTGGIFLSPDRWFWAVLTAFLVFTNTQSRGETAIRGLERAAGTALGIAVGMGLAVLVSGALWPTILIVAISLFLAFYLLTLSYSALTFFMTVAISLVYGLIGTFTPELLVLRLEETVIGAAAGIFVSFFVLPRSTSSQTRQAVDRFMQTLDQLLETAAALQPGDNEARLLVRARQLDRAHADIRDAVGPLQSAWTFGAGQAGVRRALMRLNAIVHASHVLVRRFAATPPTDGERERLLAMRARIAALAEHGCNFFGRSEVAEMPEAQDGDGSASSESVEMALRLISHVLAQADPERQARGRT